jgi:glycosyltransferase involved in cell wall biosynthesis
MAQSLKRPPRVAIAHDWLTNMGGAERVVLAFHQAFPEAPIFTSVYRPEKVPLFKGLDVRTTWLQKIPLASRAHQLFAYLRPAAFRSLKLDEYDVVLSSCSAESKHANGDKVVHVCYCHTPTRYYWSHYDEYVKNPGLGFLNIFVRPLLKLSIGALRKKDLEGAADVDLFVGNSTEVTKRIKTYYNRKALTLLPPVEIDRFSLYEGPRSNYYLISGRQVPYKRFDIAVEACNNLGRRLIVIGTGPEHEKLKKMAGKTVKFLQADDKEIVRYFQKAKALLYPGLEDAGITPIEALACGTPVIAYGRGGVLDTVKSNEDGLYFMNQTVESLTEAILAFERLDSNQKTAFKPKLLRSHAEAFSTEKFVKNIQKIVDRAYSL